MRVHPAAPVRRREIVVATISGIVMAASAVQSLTNAAGWTLSRPLIAALYVASIAAAVLAALTGLPQALAEPSVAFWGGGGLTRMVIVGAGCGCASLVATILVIQLLGTPPAR